MRTSSKILYTIGFVLFIVGLILLAVFNEPIGILFFFLGIVILGIPKVISSMLRD